MKKLSATSQRKAKPEVSVVIPVRNAQKYIRNCLRSLSDQTFDNFEIILIDDMSSDNTKDILEKSYDRRMRYLRNEKWLGIAKSRNRGLEHAVGKYIFFTDSDCTVSKNWIEEGLRVFKNHGCVGVEGKTYYISKEYKPTRSDSFVENRKGGEFLTCNMAYKKSVLNSIGGFDERFTYTDDRDLALRAMNLGRILFDPSMIVYHQKITLTPYQFVKAGKRIRDRVLLYKKFKDTTYFTWRIVYPLDLMATIFPPLILTSLFRNVYRTKEDFALFPFTYIRLIYERLCLWKMCAKERVFLI